MTGFYGILSMNFPLMHCIYIRTYIYIYVQKYQQLCLSHENGLSRPCTRVEISLRPSLYKSLSAYLNRVAVGALSGQNR